MVFAPCLLDWICLLIISWSLQHLVLPPRLIVEYGKPGDTWSGCLLWGRNNQHVVKLKQKDQHLWCQTGDETHAVPFYFLCLGIFSV